MFGMKMELDFAVTLNGKVTIIDRQGQENEVTITFTFSRDDNFWLYIDGKLVLDLGGIHDALQGEINFETGDVKVSYVGTSGEKYKNIASEQPKIFERLGLQNQEEVLKELSQGTHKITIFSGERGLYDFNLKLSFNFSCSSELNITNEIDTSAANENFNPALETIGSLNYTTENQVANGEILVVEDSAGYLHTSDKQVFHSLSSFNGMSSTVDQDQNAEVLC